MRVVVAADACVLGSADLTSTGAGVALARAWAAQGAECAVVAMGEAGAGFLDAVADLTRGSFEDLPGGVEDAPVRCLRARDVTAVGLSPAPPGDASSHALGAAVATALARPGDGEVLVELPPDACDAGAGFLAGLGATATGGRLTAGLPGLAGTGRVDLGPARALLGGRRLVGVVPHPGGPRPLLGISGVAATAGFAQGWNPARALELERGVRALVVGLGLDPDTLPDDAGAAGGLGLAFAALGGGVVTGPAWCATRTGLAGTLRQADLVVTTCTRLGYDAPGTGVTAHLRAACAEAGVPLVVVAGELSIAARELRELGVETAYAVAPPSPRPEALTDALADIARTWTW